MEEEKKGTKRKDQEIQAKVAEMAKMEEELNGMRQQMGQAKQMHTQVQHMVE